jgi:hypothetical protein
MVDDSAPVEANKHSLMVLDRGDKVTRLRQAFAELHEATFPKEL